MLSYIKEIVEQRGIFLCNLGTKYSRRQDSVDLNLLRNSALCFFTDRATGASILSAVAFHLTTLKFFGVLTFETLLTFKLTRNSLKQVRFSFLTNLKLQKALHTTKSQNCSGLIDFIIHAIIACD